MDSSALGARAEHGPGAVVGFVVHGALTRLLSTALADNLDEALVNTHFVSNTGTVVMEWAPDFAPETADGLVGGLHALTWNDRPVGDYEGAL